MKNEKGRGVEGAGEEHQISLQNRLEQASVTAQSVALTYLHSKQTLRSHMTYRRTGDER